jgi:hypothetical protein
MLLRHDMSDLAMGTLYKDLGFSKVKCAKCGKEFLTDTKGKTMRFDCEKLP